MCTGNSDIQDLYFTRDNVSSRLLCHAVLSHRMAVLSRVLAPNALKTIQKIPKGPCRGTPICLVSA